MQKCIFGVLCGVLIGLSCVSYVKYIPDPEKDIEMWVQNLSRQRSFRYAYELKTKAVSTSARGVCVIDRGEHVHGSWFSPDSAVPFEYYGFGDIEYSREQGRWQKMSRGDESNILAQITRLLEFRTFEYRGFEDTYSFAFKANIPFLVPGRWKEMVGFMEVSGRNYLPVMIWAGLPDSSVYWRIELSDYNKVKKIDPPVQAWNTFRVPLGHDYLRGIKKRLDLSEVICRVDRSGQDMLLSLPQFFTIEDAEALLRKRSLRVFGVTQERAHASRVGYVRGNETGPIYLVDVICSEQDVKHADIKFDGASRPNLILKLTDAFTFTGTIAFEVDSVIVGTAVLDTLKKFSTITMHSDMSFYELQLLKAYFIQPLPDAATGRSRS